MKEINDFIAEKLTINSKTKLHKIYELSNEEYHAIHEACLMVDNVKKLTDNLVDVANKIKNFGKITFENVASSMYILILSKNALKESKMEIKSSEGITLLRYYITSMVLSYYADNIGNLSKEVQEKVEKYYYTNINW